MAEDKPARKPPAAASEPAGQIAPAGAEALTPERIAAMAADVSQLGPLGVGETAADSDVTKELSGGGVAFGEFTKAVGLAVAAAQSELDKSLVETAKALSATQIDVVAVFEQQIKDSDGTMDKGIVHIQKLPLINYLMPTAYQWSRVYLEADMEVKEFNALSGIEIKQQSLSVGASAGGSIGLGGASGSFSAGFHYGQSSVGVEQSVSTDSAAGKLHMEATLEPRSDVQLPKPFVLQKGPRMQLLIGARTPIHENADPLKPIVGMSVKLTAILTKTDGAAMEQGKPLALNISEPTLNYTASGETDGNGKMDITITRGGASYDPSAPVQAMVRVSFGLVTQSVGISL